jgi:hypothetical protein
VEPPARNCGGAGRKEKTRPCYARCILAAPLWVRRSFGSKQSLFKPFWFKVDFWFNACFRGLAQRIHQPSLNVFCNTERSELTAIMEVSRHGAETQPSLSYPAPTHFGPGSLQLPGLRSTARLVSPGASSNHWVILSGERSGLYTWDHKP